jgi:GT2 family glycosyltransferase
METACNRRYRQHPDTLEAYQAFVHGNYPRATHLLERLHKRSPRSAGVLNDLGICRYLDGDRAGARRTLEQSARLAGKSSTAEINRLYLFHPDGFVIHDQPIQEHTYPLPKGSVDLSGERVSIILLEYNNPEITLACLRSLGERRPSLPFEILLIDNSEGPPAMDYRAASGLRELRYRKNKENVGFARGCNQGASIAQGSLLYFVNNDTLFRDRSVEELARLFAADDAVGIAGSRLLYRDESIQHAGIVFTHLAGRPEHRCRFGLSHDPVVNIPLEMQAVTGASLMIRRSLFRDVGGFREAYRNGYEDLDLCLRVRRAGSKVIYNPRSVLDHLESMSRDRTRHEEANLRLFRETWGKTVRRDEREYLGRNEHFLLSFTDDPGRGRRQRQWQGLCAHLIRKHPGVPTGLPLHCLESSKHLRFQKTARNLLSFLLEQGEPDAAGTVYRYFLIRQGFRVGAVRGMRQALGGYHS